MLHMPMPLRGNNRDHRKEMGTMRLGTSRKRGNTTLQQTSRKITRNKREDAFRGSKRPSTNWSSQASGFRGDPAPSRISSDERRE